MPRRKRPRTFVDKAPLWMETWNQVPHSTLLPPSLKWKSEFMFDACIGRRHRFDWALPKFRVGVEVDGGTWLPRGGRHGNDKDREKLNLAASLGWFVFRFSPAMLCHDPGTCVKQVEAAIVYQKENSDV